MRVPLPASAACLTAHSCYHYILYLHAASTMRYKTTSYTAKRLRTAAFAANASSAPRMRLRQTNDSCLANRA